MVTSIAREAAIERAIDPGFQMEPGEVMQTTSTTDEKFTVYSMIDGAPHEILKAAAKYILSKTLSDKTPAFWAPGLPGEPPEYVKGHLACYLDPHFDEKDGLAGFDRAWLDSIGLEGRTCNMMAPDKGIQKFKSVFSRDEHTKKKHRTEWATIQSAKDQQRLAREADERRQDREAQVKTAEAMLALAGQRRGPGRPPNE